MAFHPGKKTVQWKGMRRVEYGPSFQLTGSPLKPRGFSPSSVNKSFLGTPETSAMLASRKAEALQVELTQRREDKMYRKWGGGFSVKSVPTVKIAKTHKLNHPAVSHLVDATVYEIPEGMIDQNLEMQRSGEDLGERSVLSVKPEGSLVELKPGPAAPGTEPRPNKKNRPRTASAVLKNGHRTIGVDHDVSHKKLVHRISGVSEEGYSFANFPPQRDVASFIDEAMVEDDQSESNVSLLSYSMDTSPKVKGPRSYWGAGFTVGRRNRSHIGWLSQESRVSLGDHIQKNLERGERVMGMMQQSGARPRPGTHAGPQAFKPKMRPKSAPSRRENIPPRQRPLAFEEGTPLNADYTVPTEASKEPWTGLVQDASEAEMSMMASRDDTRHPEPLDASTFTSQPTHTPSNATIIKDIEKFLGHISSGAVSIRVRALNAMAETARTSEKYQDMLRETGTFKRLISMLLRMSGDKADARTGPSGNRYLTDTKALLTCLSSICYSNRMNRSVFRMFGGITKVVELLHKGDNIILYTLTVIDKFFENDMDSQHEFMERGGLERMEIILRSSTNSEIQILAAAGLLSLVQDNPRNLNHFVTLGGVATLIRLADSKHFKLAETACLALGFLCVQDPGIRESIAKSNGISKPIALLQKRPTERVVTAIAEICDVHRGNQTQAGKEAVDVLIGVLDLAYSLSMQLKTIVALATLSNGNKINAAHLGQRGGITRLLELLENPSTSNMAAMCLSIICDNLPDNQTMAREAIPLLMGLLDMRARNPLKNMYCLSALRAIVRDNNEHKSEASPFVPLIIEMMKSKKHDLPLRVLAMNVAAELVQDHQTNKEIAQELLLAPDVERLQSTCAPESREYEMGARLLKIAKHEPPKPRPDYLLINPKPQAPSVHITKAQPQPLGESSKNSRASVVRLDGSAPPSPRYANRTDSIGSVHSCEPATEYVQGEPTVNENEIAALPGMGSSRISTVSRVDDDNSIGASSDSSGERGDRSMMTTQPLGEGAFSPIRPKSVPSLPAAGSGRVTTMSHIDGRDDSIGASSDDEGRQDEVFGPAGGLVSFGRGSVGGDSDSDRGSIIGVEDISRSPAPAPLLTLDDDLERDMGAPVDSREPSEVRPGSFEVQELRKRKPPGVSFKLNPSLPGEGCSRIQTMSRVDGRDDSIGAISEDEVEMETFGPAGATLVSFGRGSVDGGSDSDRGSIIGIEEESSGSDLERDMGAPVPQSRDTSAMKVSFDGPSTGLPGRGSSRITTNSHMEDGRDDSFGSSEGGDFEPRNRARVVSFKNAETMQRGMNGPLPGAGGLPGYGSSRITTFSVMEEREDSIGDIEEDGRVAADDPVGNAAESDGEHGVTRVVSMPVEDDLFTQEDFGDVELFEV